MTRPPCSRPRQNLTTSGGQMDYRWNDDLQIWQVRRGIDKTWLESDFNREFRTQAPVPKEQALRAILWGFTNEDICAHNVAVHSYAATQHEPQQLSAVAA